MDFLFDILFEFLAEGIAFLYFKLMCGIVPNKKYDACTAENIKYYVKIEAMVLLCIVVVGLIFQMISGFQTVGLFLIFIPIAIICLQIISGVVVKILTFVKNNKE